MYFYRHMLHIYCAYLAAGPCELEKVFPANRFRISSELDQLTLLSCANFLPTAFSDFITNVYPR